MACAQGGIKRGSSIGRLSRNSSFRGGGRQDKCGPWRAAAALIIDIEAQAQRGGGHHMSGGDPHRWTCPQSAPARHSTLPSAARERPQPG